MKHLIIFLFSGFLITSQCSAQDITEDDPVKVTGSRGKPLKRKVTVTFVPNDTCNLKINGEDYGEIARNIAKSVRLPLGNYRLFFESLETGETIKKRSFRLTIDSLKGGEYIYPVTFKQPN